MRKVQIITDSCSDLSKELLEKYHIDYAAMNTVYNGETRRARLEWTREEAHELYELMRAGKRVTTTQVPVEEFNTVFRRYLEQDCDIVYISCCVKQSGSINTGHVVAGKLMEEFPGSTIICIDSLNACLGEGIVAIEAAKLAMEGKTAEEIRDAILPIRKTVNEFCTVHSLDALRRAGRVKATSAFFGNLMGVKPIIICDAEGYQASFKKVKGRQASMKEIVKLMKEAIKDPENQTVYFGHADCSDEEVAQMTELIRAEIPCRDIFTGIIGPIIGASIGPDALVLYAFGEEVTYNIGD